MATLSYGAIVSLDGYLADEQGGFDWGAPDEELMAHLNEIGAPVGTYLYGRWMYETMAFWETARPEDLGSPAYLAFAEVWRAADKVVYSRTLPEPGSARTRLERRFDVDEVRRLKDAATKPLEIAGAELAGHAFRGGLVDELHLYVCPIAVGGGTRALPAGVRLDLELLDERRFTGGVVHLHHRVRGGGPEPR